MSPFRWDVLLVGFVLALPVLALGLRGDLTTEEMMNRLLWCLGAGWAVVAVIRLATTPRTPTPSAKSGASAGGASTSEDPAEPAEHSPAV